ncbi:response regulator [Pseudomonas sp. KCJK9016]|uniref:response regulator n=1 Tax=Pseudomonas sp. KCJK9016 TaxID=3344556 RepID=UPI003905CEF5
MNNRVLIVDDHPALRMAISLLLASEGFDVVAETDNGADALKLTWELAPSTLILDIGIPVVDGLRVISELVRKRLPVKIIVLTGLAQNQLAERCRRLGAHGFVSKQSELSELVNAIRAVRANEAYFPGLAAAGNAPDVVVTEYCLLARLSMREFRIMQHLVQGMSNKQIAEAMLLNSKTVSTYKTRLLYKLNLGSVVDLYAFAQRNGVV